MSLPTRRYTRQSSSSESTHSRPATPAEAQNARLQDGSDSPETDDHGETTTSIPAQVLRSVEVQKREMTLNFGVLHDALRDTNERLRDTNERLDKRFDDNDKKLGQLKAQMRNQRATHVNNVIEPVGLDDGTPVPFDLSRHYEHVHDFLRLKHRSKWKILAELLRFYGTTSWPTWGLVSLSFGDNSDMDEPLVTHDTLETAIDWAPEIALQELAMLIGLDYNGIMSNLEEYEALQGRRAVRKKRTTVSGVTASGKRTALGAAVGQSLGAQRAERDAKPASWKEPSEVLGWDDRATEDRTPESQRLRFTDAPPRGRRVASPTSVATS